MEVFPENRKRIVKDMNFQINDIVEATDSNGTYRQERGTVVKITKNLLGHKLIDVVLDSQKHYDWYTDSGFYPHELKLISRP